MAYSKFNIVYQMQKWMDSVAGQTFLNYAYSWGASIVILGTLFKLTHLPGADLFLFLGMGTEVFVFFISAFDRPFDKTADGMSLQTSAMQQARGAQSAAVQTAFPMYDQFKELSSHIADICLKIERLENLLPDTDTDLKEKLDSLRDAYAKQLEKTELHTSEIERSTGHLKLMTEHLMQLNAIYGRMVMAVRQQ